MALSVCTVLPVLSILTSGLPAKVRPIQSVCHVPVGFWVQRLSDGHDSCSLEDSRTASKNLQRSVGSWKRRLSRRLGCARKLPVTLIEKFWTLGTPSTPSTVRRAVKSPALV